MNLLKSIEFIELKVNDHQNNKHSPSFSSLSMFPLYVRLKSNIRRIGFITIVKIAYKHFNEPYLTF